MKSYTRLLFVCLVAFSAGCKKDSNDPVVLSIGSFAPTHGAVSATVIITGNNFSATPNGNAVSFNGTSAIVTSSTSTSITTTVPSGATTGKISVTVGGKTATSASDFIIDSPSITTITPAYGLPGTTIILSGTNFGQGSVASYVVEVNGTVASVTTVSDTEIQFTIPDAATTGTVSITVNGSTYTSTESLEVLIDFPRNGLVAFYPFNNSPNDLSGNSLNGTLASYTDNGGPASGQDRFLSANHAYSFSGVGDYIKIANADVLNIQGNLTLSLWINNAEVKNTILLTKQPTTQTSSDCSIYQIDMDIDGGNSAKSNFFFATRSESEAYTGNSVVSTGTWFLLTIVVDGTTLTTYINGNASTATTGTIDALGSYCVGDLILGATWNYTDYINTRTESFHGLLDDFMIFNRALSANEVLQLNAQTVTKY